LSPEYTEKNGLSRKIRHFRKKRKSRPEFLQKCKNCRTANVHRICLDIIPLIEYNKVSFGEGGRMRMKYLSTFEAAEKWGISHRRVSVLCNEGRITGAQRAGSRWIIPENAEKPSDARIRSGKYIKKPTKERGT
jgi:hypothetical protein